MPTLRQQSSPHLPPRARLRLRSKLRGSLGLLALSVSCFAAIGCTVVGVRGPVGEPLSEEERSAFVGEWHTADGDRVVVSPVPGSTKWLMTTFTKEGKTDEEMELVATTFDDDSIVFWGSLEQEGFVAPAKVVDSDNAVVLFLPDLDHVKRLASNGTLKRVNSDEKGAYLMEPDGMEAQLKTKTFWNLDSATPLIRRAPSAVSGKSTAP